MYLKKKKEENERKVRIDKRNVYNWELKTCEGEKNYKNIKKKKGKE